MVTIITHGTDTIYPTLVDGFQSDRTRPNRVKTVLGREDVDVTLRPATLRTGTLRLVFGDTGPYSTYIIIDGIVVVADIPGSTAEEASKTAEDLHATGNDVFTLSDPDRPTLMLSYVVNDNGSIHRELDDSTRGVWILTVDFQEVTV